MASARLLGRHSIRMTLQRICPPRPFGVDDLHDDCRATVQCKKIAQRWY
jgi:hypothetical protein